MGKLSIEKIVIDKTDKDIDISKPFEFSDGFNVISGKNEAGKSSLMSFIKSSFLNEKDLYKGRLHFKIDDDGIVSSYRAEYDGKSAKNKNLKITSDKNNENVTSKIIDKYLNEKYINYGFIINLDNLADLKSNDKISLVNIIKDPAGDNFNNLIDEIKSKSKKIFGDNNKFVGDTNILISQIKTLDKEIQELKGKEGEYNEIIQEIASVEREINNKVKELESYKLQKKINELKDELDIKISEKNKLNVNFNQKLYENKEEYQNLIEKYGQYKNNTENIKKLDLKIDDIQNEITNKIRELNSEFQVSFDEDSIKNFKVNNESFNQIKDMLKELQDLNIELINQNRLYDENEDKLINIKSKLQYLKENSINNDEKVKLKEIYKKTDEGLKQYNYLLNELSGKEKPYIGKSIYAVLIVMILISLSALILGFYQKNNNLLYIGGASVAASICAFVILIKSYSKEDLEKINFKNSVLEKLKSMLIDYDESIKHYEKFNLFPKLDALRQEILNKLNKIEAEEKDIESLQYEIIEGENKINTIKNKIEELNQKIFNIQENIKSIIEAENPSFNIDRKNYHEVILAVKSLKEYLKQKSDSENENLQYKNNNENIKKDIYEYIKNNETDIEISENIEETIENLKEYFRKNNDIKSQIDILCFEINGKRSEIESLMNKNIDFNPKEIIIDIDNKINETDNELKIKQDYLIECKTKKNNLEKFEGISNLKISRDVYFEKFKNKVKKLFEYQMTIKLSEKAKKNFDKTQPDLINAQKFLSILTNGKYEVINLDREEIEDKTGKVVKKWNELSRGTREQLYLALRLGYASNYTKDGVTNEPNGRADLPLIIDDAFVNFDLERTKNALRCLYEFSKTNQVLFFTCHYDLIKQYIYELNLNDKVNTVELIMRQ